MPSSDAAAQTTCPYVPTFNPFAEAGYDWLNAELGRARTREPIFFDRATNMWVASRYDEVSSILQDTQRFSSSVRHVIVGNLAPQAQALVRGTLTFSAPNLSFDADPEHARLRHPFVKRFSVRGVAKYEVAILNIVRDVLAPLPSNGLIDVVKDYSRPIAIRVIMHLAGFKPQDVELVAHYGEAVSAFFFGIIPADQQETYAQTMLSWETYLRDFIAWRRQRPGGDMTSRLLADIAAGRAKYSDDEIISFLSFDIVGVGIPSVSYALPTLFRELLADRKHWSDVQETPTRFDALFMESIRRRPLSVGLFRQAIVDSEVGGVTIPAGAVVWILNASADHDEKYFARPFDFLPDRNVTRPTLSFGQSLHFCLGKNLTRLVTRIALREFQSKYPNTVMNADQTWTYEPSYNVMVMGQCWVTA